ADQTLAEFAGELVAGEGRWLDGWCLLPADESTLLWLLFGVTRLDPVQLESRGLLWGGSNDIDEPAVMDYRDRYGAERARIAGLVRPVPLWSTDHAGWVSYAEATYRRKLLNSSGSWVARDRWKPVWKTRKRKTDMGK